MPARANAGEDRTCRFDGLWSTRRDSEQIVMEVLADWMGQAKATQDRVVA